METYQAREGVLITVHLNDIAGQVLIRSDLNTFDKIWGLQDLLVHTMFLVHYCPSCLPIMIEIQ